MFTPTFLSQINVSRGHGPSQILMTQVSLCSFMEVRKTGSFHLVHTVSSNVAHWYTAEGCFCRGTLELIMPFLSFSIKEISTYQSHLKSIYLPSMARVLIGVP